MSRILTFYDIEPVLDTKVETAEGPNKGVKYGLHRDIMPDAGWGELRWTRLDKAVNKYDSDGKLKVKLLEDLAFAFGKDSTKFREKLIEFKLI